MFDRFPCPSGCGKKFISKDHADTHASLVHSLPQVDKRKNWVTPYGFSDFTHPVTYEEACKTMKALSEQFNKEKK